MGYLKDAQAFRVPGEDFQLVLISSTGVLQSAGANSLGKAVSATAARFPDLCGGIYGKPRGRGWKHTRGNVFKADNGCSNGFSQAYKLEML